jgi:hypothetical protein
MVKTRRPTQKERRRVTQPSKSTGSLPMVESPIQKETSFISFLGNPTGPAFDVITNGTSGALEGLKSMYALSSRYMLTFSSKKHPNGEHTIILSDDAVGRFVTNYKPSPYTEPSPAFPIVYLTWAASRIFVICFSSSEENITAELIEMFLALKTIIKEAEKTLFLIEIGDSSIFTQEPLLLETLTTIHPIQKHILTDISNSAKSMKEIYDFALTQ